MPRPQNSRKSGKTPYEKPRRPPPRSTVQTAGDEKQHTLRKMIVVHTGHSFVRRSKCAMLNQHYSKNSYLDTRQEHDEDGRLARRHNLFLRVKSIHTFARNISRIEQMVAHVGSIKALNPDMVLFELGSNELANMPENVPQNDLFIVANYLKSLAACFHPTICVFMGVVPRISNINSSPEAYKQYAKWFNGFLHQFEQESLRGSYPTNFRYHKMQGWHYKKDRHNRDVECPPEDWVCHDGVHPTVEHMKNKHSATLKKAILDYKNIPHY